MTITTAPSSSVLLNPVVQPGNSPVATEAEAVPDAALSGFQLLLGALQQLSEPLPANTTEATDSEAASKNADEAGSDSGNLLPLLGLILPQAGSAETTKADATDTAKSKSKKDQDADASATNVMPPAAVVPLAGFVIQPQPHSDSGSAPTAAAQTDAALAVQSGFIKDTDAGRANNTAVAAKPKGDTNSLAAATVVDVDAAAVGKDVQAVAKNVGEADFDVLVKHFDAPNQTSLPAISIGDSSVSNHASRTYLNAASTTASVPVPVGSDGWSDAVADKVMWFSANKISSAEIHLNPPDLGPLQVRVSTQHDQMSVVFTSQHAAVRDALDQALPRLRDMMGSQGMHSLDVSVGGQNAQQQQQQFSRNDSARRDASFDGFPVDDAADSSVNVTTINTARLLRSGVDAYA